MLSTSLGRVLAVVITGAALTVLASPAHADDGIGGVDCHQGSTASECGVHVGTPGRPGTGGGDNTNTNGGGSGDGSGGDTSGCRYERVEPQRPPPPGAGTGGWYTRICPVAGGGAAQSQAMWVPGAAPAVDPAVLAAQARSNLRMVEPSIRLNPAPPAAQLLFLPTWLWLPSEQWNPVTATASVPGLSVTATATPVRVTWSTGDGSTRVCEGAGSAWTAGMDPKRASPTCGHTYTSTSAGQPGGTFQIRATVTWQVTWAGGGDGGTLDPLTTTSAVPVRVVQSNTYNQAG